MVPAEQWRYLTGLLDRVWRQTVSNFVIDGSVRDTCDPHGRAPGLAWTELQSYWINHQMIFLIYTGVEKDWQPLFCVQRPNREVGFNTLARDWWEKLLWSRTLFDAKRHITERSRFSMKKIPKDGRLCSEKFRLLRLQEYVSSVDRPGFQNLKSSTLENNKKKKKKNKQTKKNKLTKDDL